MTRWTWSLEGLISLLLRYQQAQSVSPCCPNKSSRSQCCQVLALFSGWPSWECGVQGFHTLDNLREARKRETTMTSVRAEVFVCVEKSKGKLVNASDSWLTNGNKITKAVQNFTSRILETANPCCASQHLPAALENLFAFKHSF